MADVVISDEERELQEVFSKITRYPKLSRWVQLFLDKSNLITYGNRTQSAIQAYNLDPEKQYGVARAMGAQNYAKLNTIASDYMETQGMTAGKMIELLAAKAINTTNAKYLITLLEITGIYQPKAAIAIQNNTQINNNVQIQPEERVELNRQFEQFIDEKYRVEDKSAALPEPPSSSDAG